MSLWIEKGKRKKGVVLLLSYKKIIKLKYVVFI